MSILDKYVCKNPFNYLDSQGNQSYICCPSWCDTDINYEKNDSLGWETSRANEIRKSVLDGSYKFCDKKVCPSLNELIHKKTIPDNFIEKNKFTDYYGINNIEDVYNINFYPEFILFGFDRSCNLKCPSCRHSLVPNDRKNTPQYIQKNKILDIIERKFSKNVKRLLITGSGDPFYSNIYREYLQNFNKSKYSKLECIKIITNGRMLNKKMWDSLNCTEYIKDIEVSIDAGSKTTYENITRLGGSWDELIENLKFINTIPTIGIIQLSFVVNEYNFHEMNSFYNTMIDIFGKSSIRRKVEIVFRQHVYWESGKYSKEEVESIKVFEPHHPKFSDFEKEFNILYRKPYVNHNFNHLMKKTLV